MTSLVASLADPFDPTRSSSLDVPTAARLCVFGTGRPKLALQAREAPTRWRTGRNQTADWLASLDGRGDAEPSLVRPSR